MNGETLRIAGYDVRNWGKILAEQDNFIEEQIALAKKCMKPKTS